MSKNPAAPGELDLVRRFVNTIDLESGRDAIESPAALRAWLSDHELLPSRGRVTAADVTRCRAVREAIRSLLRANAGEELDASAITTLDRAVRDAGLGVRFRPGGPRLEPSTAGVSGALGRLIAVVFHAMSEGTFDRLKACREARCLWAFYDHSKNRSRSWCSMSVCGNRTKVRRFRERREK